MSKKTLQGTITKVIDHKTAKVQVERNWQHPIYKKYVKRTKNYLVDINGVEVAEGDTVIITEGRPLSKTKRFVITEKSE